MRSRLTTVHLAAAAFVFAFLFAFLRRGGTLVRPQLWSEDGTFMVPHFLTHGWWPLKGEEGYLTLAPHLITNVALTLAPHSYVVLSAWLTWIFMAGIAAYIAAAPTLLKGRVWLALACFLVPTDPEVFGVPLYSFWWAGLLLFLLTFWRTESPHPILRCATLLFAGFSSPIVIVAAPILAARAFILRHRIDIGLAVLAALCAAAQIYYVALDEHIRVAQEFTADSPRLIVERFFGWFAWETVRTNVRSDLLYAGFLVIALAGWTAWKLPDRRVGLGLLYLIAATVVTSASRTDVATLNILNGGPRYFFYPFILLSWLFIQGLYARPFALGRVLCAVVLAGAVHNALASGWSRDHQNLDFERHLASCLHFDTYSMPLQLEGNLLHVWHHDYPREFCERLGGDPQYEPSRLYPFSVRSTDSGIAASPGSRMIGSDGADANEVTVTLARGTRILFETSAITRGLSYEVNSGDITFRGEVPACVRQCSLDFSSDLLPEQFAVTFTDTASDGWFALGAPPN